MAFDRLATLKGKSGADYLFGVVSRQSAFQAKPGVYALAKSIGPDRYAFCFVGQSADLSKRPLNPDKTACFDRFGADLIFVLEEYDANKRAQMVTDLVQAYGPTCNAP